MSAAPPSARKRSGLVALRRMDPRVAVLVIAGVVVAYLALVPVGTMLVASLRSSFLSEEPATWTLGKYLQTYTAHGFGEVVYNSIVYAAASALIGTILGFGLAWLASRTNAPGRGLMYGAALFPLILPGILNTMAWTLLLSPQTGLLNSAARTLHLPTFNVFSLSGMIFVESTHLVPLAFLMGVAAFSNLDGSLEEAAMSSGAPLARVFRSITLPLIRTPFVSAGLLTFVLAISTFEVPQLVGVPGRTYVFVSMIYAAAAEYPVNYGSIGAIGVGVLVLTVAGLALSQIVARRSRAQTITGKAYRPIRTDLGRWRWLGLAIAALFALVTVVLPGLVLLWSSLLDGYQPPSMAALHSLTLQNFSAAWSTPAIAASLRNSVVTAVVAAAMVTLLSTFIAYITIKTRLRGRGVLDVLGMIPISVPSIIVGVGILFWYLAIPLPLHLYGTLALLIIAFVTIGLPYGMRYMSSGMGQIHDELEGAASVSGATWGQTFRRVYLPLLRPSLTATFLYVLMVAFREVSGVILLYTNKSEVLSVTIYNLWTTGNSYPKVAALGVLLGLFLTLMLLVVRLVGVRVGALAMPDAASRGAAR